MFDELCNQMRFLLFVLVGNVCDRYDYVSVRTEPKPVRKRTGPVNADKFTFQKSDWLDRITIQTCVNVASGEFHGSSYNTNFLSSKTFLSIFKTCPW